MDKIFQKFKEDNECFTCNVCNNDFNQNEYFPICLNCGHSFCLICLEQIGKKQKTDFKCSKCNIKVKIENKKDLIDNIIIVNILKIININPINFKSLLKLNFCYCKNCNLFLTNFSVSIHYSINHFLEPISKYTFDYFKFILENKNKGINAHIKLYFVLYFFQNPYINRFNDFSIKESFSYNNNYFIFYGKTLKNEEEFLSLKKSFLYQFLELTLINNKGKELYSIKKGYLIGNNGEFLIGYFLINENKHILYKGLGLLNYENIAFFGFLDFYTNIKKTNFSFDIGMLDNDKSIFYGIFSNNIEFPKFELQEGEIINFMNNGQYNVIKKTNQNTQISENIDKNEFFQYSENSTLYKIVFTEIMIKSKNDLNVEIGINKNDKSLNYIKIISKEQINEISNNIMIIPFYKKNSNVLDTLIINCEIFLLKYNINFRLNNEKNAFIFYETINKNYFEGYLIKESNVNLFLKEIEKIKLQDVIYSVDSIYDFIESLISSQLINFLISYQVFNQHFKFQKYLGYILFNSIHNEMIYFFDDKKKKIIQFQGINKMRIKDLFPNIYKSKSFTPILNKLKNCKLKDNECCSLL